MSYSNPGSFREQVRFLRRQFLQDGDLPFTDVLTEEVIAQALTALSGWLDRIFSPLVTLWVFLGQVLSADHSCRAAVAGLLAHRVARGQSPCSAETGAYCQARQRLPESVFAGAACSVGRGLDDQADRRWRWKGRRVRRREARRRRREDSRRRAGHAANWCRRAELLQPGRLRAPPVRPRWSQHPL